MVGFVRVRFALVSRGERDAGWDARAALPGLWGCDASVLGGCCGVGYWPGGSGLGWLGGERWMGLDEVAGMWRWCFRAWALMNLRV